MDYRLVTAMNYSGKTQIGVVVPTLGERIDLLRENLNSLRQAGASKIVLVSPRIPQIATFMTEGLADEWLEERGNSLEEAVNQGMQSLKGVVEFCTWLGDDDLLHENALLHLSNSLKADEKAIVSFGGCSYINTQGTEIWVNKSGRWAPILMRFGPNMIPQPATLYRLADFLAVGGLRKGTTFACDLDLFLRLKKLGKFIFVPRVLASFRWHQGSMTVSQRKKSVKVASQIRVSHLPKILKLISELWEAPVRYLTLIAGRRLSRD